MLSSCVPNQDENGDFLHGAEFDPTTTTDPGTGSGVTKYLSKMTAVDSDGEKVVFTYGYTSGKLTSVNTDDNSISYTLIYSGDLINKMTIIEDDGSTKSTTNLNVNYSGGKFSSAEGTTTEDSGNSYSEKLTSTYTGGKLTKLVTKAIGFDISDPTITYDLWSLQSDITYSGNNISSWKLSTAFPPTPPITIPPIVITTNLSNYDSSKNPFATLPETFNIISAHYGTEYQAVTGLSANNYKNIAVASDFGSDSTVYTYTYDADKYPTKAVSSLNTLTFEYKK